MNNMQSSVPNKSSLTNEVDATPAQRWKDWAVDYDDLEVPKAEETELSAKVMLDLISNIDGPVLETAAGTGRISIPLSMAGRDVTATDSSPDMLEVLKSKPGSAQIKTLVQTMPEVCQDEKYALVLILLNTIWAMTDPDEQLLFVRNCADALLPDGLFIVEMGVPNPGFRPSPENINFTDGTPGVMERKYYPATQRVLLTYRIATDHAPLRRMPLRFIYPNELLLMGHIAGLQVKHCWQDWDLTPYGPTALTMIVVFEKIPE